MKQMTEQNLINAFGGESQAHMRYLHFANQADKEKFPNVARLFRAVAHAEYVHAGDHYRELRHLNGGVVANSMAAFGPGDTKKNLGLAIAGEDFKITEMYPTYIEVAKFQGEKGHHLVLDANVGEGAAHHDLMIAAARAVLVEILRSNLVIAQVLAGRACFLDRSRWRDVVGGDRVEE